MPICIMVLATLKTNYYLIVETFTRDFFLNSLFGTDSHKPRRFPKPFEPFRFRWLQRITWLHETRKTIPKNGTLKTNNPLIFTPMTDAVICMTACIQPNTVMVSAVNVDERLADYKKCIRFYLDQTDLPIYFLENSDHYLDSDKDFQEFQNLQRFTVLRFSPHPNTKKGKGFQEFYTLDRFVKDHLHSNSFIKVTGR